MLSQITYQVTIGLLNGLVFGLIIALIAVGLTLIFGLMEILNIAHGEFYMLGAVIGWYIVSMTGNFWYALLIAPLIVGVIGMAAERIVLRPIEDKFLPPVIATFGLLFVFQNSVLMFFGGAPQQISSPIESVSLLGISYSGWRLGAGALSLIFLSLIYVILYRTDLGMLIRASKQNREAALAMGVNVQRMYMSGFGLGAAAAAFGGVVAAPIVGVHYLMGVNVLVLSFMVVIIGGFGSLKGAVTVGIIIEMVEGIGSVFLTPLQARILLLMLLVAVLIVRPTGIFGESR